MWREGRLDFLLHSFAPGRTAHLPRLRCRWRFADISGFEGLLDLLAHVWHGARGETVGHPPVCRGLVEEIQQAFML